MKTISDKYFSLCNELRMYIIDFLSKNGNEIGIYCRNEYELINLGIDNINDVPDSELESNDSFFIMSDEHTYPNFITLMNIYNEIQFMNSNN